MLTIKKRLKRLIDYASLIIQQLLLSLTNNFHNLLGGHMNKYDISPSDLQECSVDFHLS